jgi:hypothetical protein
MVATIGCGRRNPAADVIRVTSPVAGQKVSSPLVIRGAARGSWYFEASFPVRLVDEAGQNLAAGTARAQGDWMTTAFVPFEATLTFTSPRGKSGTLILEKDNPSGLARNAAELRVPVRFH